MDDSNSNNSNSNSNSNFILILSQSVHVTSYGFISPLPFIRSPQEAFQRPCQSLLGNAVRFRGNPVQCAFKCKKFPEGTTGLILHGLA